MLVLGYMLIVDMSIFICLQQKLSSSPCGKTKEYCGGFGHDRVEETLSTLTLVKEKKSNNSFARV